VRYNRCFLASLLIITYLFSSVSCWSQAAGLNNVNSEIQISQDNDQFTGLLLDNTRTKAGRDFYEAVYRNWSSALLDSTENNLALALVAFTEEITIEFEEQPTMGSSTLINISVDNVLIWSQFLQPRQSVIEMLSENAVMVLSNYITNYQEFTQDLENEDSKGTGVY
jgi:hypothetical protein